MSIKADTIHLIEVVLSQGKKYYQSKEFPFPCHKNGYSTHQGAVLRYYLRANGYVNVRVSEVSDSFFAGTPGESFKPSNTVIMKKTDFDCYSMENGLKHFMPASKGMKLVPLKTTVKPYKQVFLDNRPVIRLLIDKYSKRFEDLRKYYSLNKDDLPLSECSDIHNRLNDLDEIIKDLRSIS